MKEKIKSTANAGFSSPLMLAISLIAASVGTGNIWRCPRVAATNGGSAFIIAYVAIMVFLIPGYAAALLLSFFVPATFTGIAFDSGGVASGPLTATFMLLFAMGASNALGGNVMSDAFGLVAMVAMMPLITVQGMGAVFVLKSRGKAPETFAGGGDEIIESWEIA